MQKKIGCASQQSVEGPHTHTQRDIIDPWMLHSWPERNQQLSAAFLAKCDISCNFGTPKAKALCKTV